MHVGRSRQSRGERDPLSHVQRVRPLGVERPVVADRDRRAQLKLAGRGHRGGARRAAQGLRVLHHQGAGVDRGRPSVGIGPGKRQRTSGTVGHHDIAGKGVVGRQDRVAGPRLDHCVRAHGSALHDHRDRAAVGERVAARLDRAAADQVSRVQVAVEGDDRAA